jgi:hypothetical protein
VKVIIPAHLFVHRGLSMRHLTSIEYISFWVWSNSIFGFLRRLHVVCLVVPPRSVEKRAKGYIVCLFQLDLTTITVIMLIKNDEIYRCLTQSLEVLV